MKCEQAAPTNRIANPPFRMNGGDISHKSISPTAGSGGKEQVNLLLIFIYSRPALL
jgi:hypothetical protein